MSDYERVFDSILNDDSEPRKIYACYYKKAEYNFGAQQDRKAIACKFFQKN